MGVLVLLTFGGGEAGVVQNRESPDFRSPEVARYANNMFLIEIVDASLFASKQFIAASTSYAFSPFLSHIFAFLQLYFLKK